MNDVINSQDYTQAAYWNRIPAAAWCLVLAIALCCNVLFSYRHASSGYCPGSPKLKPSFASCSRSHWNFWKLVMVTGPV
jgi:hypothetical protein